MPRKPRFFLSGVPVHIVQRGHSRLPVFFEEQDYSTYAYWLRESGQKYGVSIHSFVLMTNHIHLLVTPNEGCQLSAFMQFIGRRYVPYINRKYGKSGSLWEGRFKASLVEADRYFLCVMRYIELNPVRAGMTETAAQYRWSSFRHNTGLEQINLVTFHPAYLGLGKCKKSRGEAYQNLFSSQLGSDVLKGIRSCWETGTPLGNERFKEFIEKTLDCKVGYDRRGRPSAKVQVVKGL